MYSIQNKLVKQAHTKIHNTTRLEVKLFLDRRLFLCTFRGQGQARDNK